MLNRLWAAFLTILSCLLLVFVVGVLAARVEHASVEPPMQVASGATASPSSAALGCYVNGGVGTQANTNPTLCKSAPGNFYGFRAENPTATIAYLRMYNLAVAPTCSSATGFIESIEIPPNTVTPWIVDAGSVPINYSAGIGFCVTANAAANDGNAAVANVLITVRYK